MSTACYIWENCSQQFHVKPFIIQKIRQFRNQYFAHNTSLKASDLEKRRVFDVLKDLLQNPDVQCHINVQNCIKDLSNIEQGYQIEKWMIGIQNLVTQHGSTMHEIELNASNLQEHNTILHIRQGDIQKSQDNLIKGQDDLRRDAEIIQKDLTQFRIDMNKLFQRNESRVPSCRTLITVVSVLLSIVTILMLGIFVFKHIEHESTNDDFQKQECMSEQYSVPFPQDLPLLGYLNEHKALVGRQWLMERLQHDLFNSNSRKNHGIVLVAEMGYGKSAFVSKLLCPKSMNIDKEIHKHIVAFHVCKFDVRSTHFPERFIRRLVGFFSKRSAEYGNIVSMLPESHILFNRENCNKEPEACFDQGVTIPLKQLSSVTDTPWIVVVDAIDECESYGRNSILSLLSNRIKQLPKWLKFLITSRNITNLKSLRKMKFEYLYSNDSRNIEDIRFFIQKTFPENTKEDVINKLVHKSEGHFIYIIQALKWIIDNNDTETVPDFPADLGDIYDINFGRQFGDTSYSIPKLILEIICSAMKPISKSEIFTILKSSKLSLTVDEFDLYFKSLSFFLRINGDIRISHQALYLWLIDKHNDNYRISLQNGHALISKYLFSMMSRNERKNIVNLAIHVTNSGNSALRKRFLSSTFLDRNGLLKDPVLHKLIWKTPSTQALELLIHHFKDVNGLNEGNVTPSFVAAAKGHTDQLKLLHSKGANLNFIVKGQMLINSYDVFSKLEMMKLYYYSGYSLLHIASQHGHISTVNYILTKNHSLMHVKNSLGLNAGHVACENGHLNVVKQFKNLHSKTFLYECMYYASKQNHIHVAEWLVSNGFTFECISDKLSSDAFQNITKVDHFRLIEHGFATFPNDSVTLRLIVPLDIWWIVFKHNPLMIAIKTGSNDVAKYLHDTYQEARKCYDAFGIAALAIVRFNRTELYPLINKGIASDRCGKIPNHLNDVELIDTYLIEKCPQGGSVSHVVAIFAPGYQIYSHVIGNSLDVNWNHLDSFGNYPIHYAVANRNFLFLFLSEKGTLLSKNKHFSLIDTLALNGSTAFHTSAISGQYLSMYYLTDYFKKPVPDIKDYNGRGITHYLVLKEFDSVVSSPEMESHAQSLHTLRYLLEISNHSLNARDGFGRNILHYCLKNGHYLIVSYLLKHQKTHFYSMISHKDNEGNNPIDFAMKKYERKNYMIVLPDNDTFYDIYFNFANIKQEKFSNIMSSWELSMLLIIQTLSAQEYRLFIEPNLKYIMEKSPYLLTAVLVYHKNVNVKRLQGLLVNRNINPLTVYMHFVVARHKPLAFISCNQPLSLSPLHYVLLTHDHRVSVFYLNYIDLRNFLYMIFKQNKKSYAFKCPDGNGLNIFHCSLIGGNIQSARILMWENITVTNEYVTLEDVFFMTMQSRLKSDQRNYIKCNEHPSSKAQETCTDKFLLELFYTKKKWLNYNFFCNNKTREMSLVHLLAINGMARTLETIAKVFGRQILACQSVTGFTPLYFGKLFRQDAIVSVVGEHYALKLPTVQAEEWLIWSMPNKFPQTNVSEPLFRFSNSSPLSPYSSRCLLKESIFVSKLFKRSFSVPFIDSSHNCDKVLGYLLSSEVPSILLNISFLESFYFGNVLISCNSREALLIHQHSRIFRTTLVYFETIQYMKQRCHVFETLLRPFVVKLYQINKQFIQMKTRIIKNCEKESSFRLEGMKTYQLIVSSRKLCFGLHQLYKTVAISFLMQYGKSFNILVPNSYSFLHQRMKLLKFNDYEDFSLLPKLHPLVAINDTSVYKHRYLNIVKSTIAYKHLKHELVLDTLGIQSLIDQSETEAHVIESILLKEPFKDLQ